MESLSDAVLIRRLLAAVRQARTDEADLVTLIAEVDARKLYLRHARPSMFLYCTEVLHLSEQEAYLRITVGRASREHPCLLPMIRDGRLHLSGIARLTKYLTRQNRDEVLKRATHKTRREIEKLVAELEPRPDAPSGMRRLPTRSAVGAWARSGIGAGPLPGDGSGGSPGNGATGGASRPGNGAASGRDGDPEATATHPFIPGQLCPDRADGSAVSSHPDVSPPILRTAPATMHPLAPNRYRVQFTASAEMHDKLERLQALMRSSVPDGDLGRVIEAAVTEKLERLEAKRFGKTATPRKALEDTETTPASRHVPAAVRRTVHARDQGRCTYVDARGNRCTARERLEFHHHGTPFGRGGDHSPRNVRLMCRAHNRLLAEREYGKEKMDAHRRAAARSTSAGKKDQPASPPVRGHAQRPPASVSGQGRSPSSGQGRPPSVSGRIGRPPPLS